MGDCFKTLLNDCFKVYVGDILLHSDAPQGMTDPKPTSTTDSAMADSTTMAKHDAVGAHITHLEKMFALADNCNLRFRLKKFNLFRRCVRHLGHILSAAGRSTDPRYVQGVSEYKRPTSKDQVQRFIGLCGFYSKFIQNYSTRIAPLRRHTKTAGFLGWSDDDEKSFLDMKAALLSSPVLRNPDWSGDSPDSQCDLGTLNYRLE